MKKLCKRTKRHHRSVPHEPSPLGTRRQRAEELPRLEEVIDASYLYRTPKASRLLRMPATRTCHRELRNLHLAGLARSELRPSTNCRIDPVRQEIDEAPNYEETNHTSHGVYVHRRRSSLRRFCARTPGDGRLAHALETVRYVIVRERMHPTSPTGILTLLKLRTGSRGIATVRTSSGQKNGCQEELHKKCPYTATIAWFAHIREHEP